MRLSGCWPLGYLNIHEDILPKRKTNTGSYGSPSGGGASHPLILACIISPIPGCNNCQPHPHLCWWSLEVQHRSCSEHAIQTGGLRQAIAASECITGKSLNEGHMGSGKKIGQTRGAPRVWGGERMLRGCLVSQTQGI